MESPGNVVAMLRCRKCRKSYIDSTCLYPIVADDDTEARCTVWHVNVEMLPEWILTSVYQAHWTVGRLNCMSCGARLGGFNFINQTKCPCGQEITVHLNKSRVDQDHRQPLHVARARTPRVEGGGQGCLQADPGGARSQQTSQLCCASFPRLHLESRPIPAHLSALDRFTESQVAQSVEVSDPSTLPLKKGFFSSVRSRAELETSSRILGLSQSSLMDSVEGQLRCWREQSPHSSQTTNTNQLHNMVDRSPNAPGLLPVCREGRPALHTEEPHPQPHIRGPTPARTAPAPGSPSVSPRGAVVRRPRTERERDREEEEEEGGSLEVQGSSAELQALLPPGSTVPAGLVRLSKRQKNRLKSQRRKQRRRERWIHSQLEKEQSVSGGLTDSEEEDRQGYTCAVCLDVYYSPFTCQPCGHVFCEPCLRTLAKNRAASTPCPLCRTLITHTLFQKELNQSAKTFFPKAYHTRKQNFQKATCSKWPLPSCRKHFGVFWGYQRQAAAGRRWHFAPAGFTLDALDLSDMRGWLFDIDLVIVYIHSVNWILALIILTFLAYFFFS